MMLNKEFASIAGAVFAVRRCVVQAYDKGETNILEPVVFVHSLVAGEKKEKVTELDASPFIAAGGTGKKLLEGFFDSIINDADVVQIVFAAEGKMISGDDHDALVSQVKADGLSSHPTAKDVIMIEVRTKARKLAFMLPLDKPSKTVGMPVALAGPEGEKEQIEAALAVGVLGETSSKTLH